MAPGGEAVRLLLISIFSTILAVPALAEEAAMPAATPIPNAEATAPAAEALPGRVGRLSLVSGNVSVRASKEWLDAVLNVPVATGASLRTGAQARAEVEIGADTIDLAPESEIEITKLDDRTIQVAVVGGRIGFALRRLGDGESVEVEVSHEGVPLLQPGRYDIDASSRRITISAGDALSGGSGPTDAMIQPAARDDF